MTAGVLGESARGAPAGRISAATQVRDAVARIGAAWRPLGVLLAVLIAAQMGFYELDVKLAGFNRAGAGFTLSQVGAIIARTLTVNLVTTVMLRVLLEGAGAWRRVDGRFWGAVALFWLADGLLTASGYAWGEVQRSAILQRQLWIWPLTAAIYLVAYCGLARLTLWPVGALMGREDVTAARSWRLMRRATRGYLLAHLVVVIPMVVANVGWVAWSVTNDPQAPTPLHAIQQGQKALAAVMGLWSAALIATIYQLRVENPATVADVFD